MSQRYDLLAVSLLFFTVVLLTALSVDPKGFALKEWQPLTAAILALGGAGVVYRGATLTYRAAMAKVELDREIHERERRRRHLGVFIRIRFAVYRLQIEVEMLKNSTEGFLAITEPVTFTLGKYEFSTLEDLEEAWLNLDVFPGRLSRLFSELRFDLVELRRGMPIIGEQTRTIEPGSIQSKWISALHRVSENTIATCQTIYKSLDAEIGDAE